MRTGELRTLELSKVRPSVSSSPGAFLIFFPIPFSLSSWGYDLSRNKLYHDIKNCEVTNYPNNLGAEDTLVIPDEFLVVLDMDEGTLAFVIDGQYLGVAFSGLKGKKIYPVVSAVWGHCEITMKYYGGLDRKCCIWLFVCACDLPGANCCVR